MATKDDQVSFKLDSTEYEDLTNAAVAAGSKSPNIHARQLVLTALLGGKSELAELRESVDQLKGEMTSLRQFIAARHAVSGNADADKTGDLFRALRVDLAVATTAVLKELRPGDTTESITEWVKKNLS